MGLEPAERELGATGSHWAEERSNSGERMGGRIIRRCSLLSSDTQKERKCECKMCWFFGSKVGYSGFHILFSFSFYKSLLVVVVAAVIMWFSNLI